MSKKFFLVVIFLSMHGLSAPSTANPATELSRTMLPKEQYDQMIEGIVQTGLAMANAKVEQDKLKVDFEKESQKIEKSLREKFTYDYFISMNSKTMKKNFSEVELKTILGFYQTDLGRKWIKHTPEIITETMLMVQTDLQEQLPKLVDAMVSKKKGK